MRQLWDGYAYAQIGQGYGKMEQESGGMNMENMNMKAINRIYICCEQCREKMEVACWNGFGWAEWGQTIHRDDEGIARPILGLFMRKHTHLSPYKSYDDDAISEAQRVVGFRYGLEGDDDGWNVTSKQQLIEWEAYDDVLRRLEKTRFELERLTELKESYEDSMRNNGNASFSSMLAIAMDEKENERKKEGEVGE